ncbi:sugar phosphate isomerase/epimerase family protein [Thauera phenylacetica]|nr:sugar phosphate isomerase/epimerase [Thauera phenylacetica]
MKPEFSMACLTALNLPPAQAIRVAARTGYTSIGIRMLPAAPGGTAYPLMDDPTMLAATLAAMKETGVKVFDLEMIRLNEAFEPETFLPFFETGQRLGAQSILVAGDDADHERMIENFARLCDAAAPYGLTCDLEFMPWTAVRDLASAKEVVRAANRPNGGILVDALHFARSSSRLEDLDDMPREWLHYAQLCDAPAEIPTDTSGLIFTARSERLLPGEGGIDLAAIFRRLPMDLPISLEIPSDSRMPIIGNEAWARDVMASGRGFFAGLR